MSQIANQEKKKLDFGDDKDHMCIPAGLVNSLRGEKRAEEGREGGREGEERQCDKQE